MVLMPDRENPKALTADRSDVFLAEVATELLTYSDESAVDVAGGLTHANYGGQRNKRDNQKVLDQSLATLVQVKCFQQSKHPRKFVALLIGESNSWH
jgi:hypothetical protein